MSQAVSSDKLSRLAEDRRTLALLLDELEISNVSIAQNLMKARKVTRLLRDSDA